MTRKLHTTFWPSVPFTSRLKTLVKCRQIFVVHMWESLAHQLLGWKWLLKREIKMLTFLSVLHKLSALLSSWYLAAYLFKATKAQINQSKLEWSHQEKGHAEECGVHTNLHITAQLSPTCNQSFRVYFQSNYWFSREFFFFCFSVLIPRWYHIPLTFYKGKHSNLWFSLLSIDSF